MEQVLGDATPYHLEQAICLALLSLLFVITFDWVFDELHVELV
jgi:hypothetical protein